MLVSLVGEEEPRGLAGTYAEKAEVEDGLTG